MPRSNDPTPPCGTCAMDAPVSCKPIIISERRSKLRLYLHASLDVAKIAALIATAHLLLRLTVSLPVIVMETKSQTIELRAIHQELLRR